MFGARAQEELSMWHHLWLRHSGALYGTRGSRDVEGLYLASDLDKRLLIYFPFMQVVKLHSVLFKGPKDDAEMHIYVINVSNGNDYLPMDIVELSSDHLIEDKVSDEVVFKAMGRAINKTVMVVELIKDRTITAHEPVILEFKIISLCRLETTRHVSMITITLSKKELDTSSIGFLFHTCKALKQLSREQVQVATKFGIRRDESGTRTVCGRPEYIRACCEASLRRLGIDCIDLYYQHRIDTTIPIEETIGELKKLVEEGDSWIADTFVPAHGGPYRILSCVKILYAVDFRELGIGIVPYSPLGHGFFGGRGVKEQVSAESNLHGIPRFAPENLEKKKQIYLRMEELANKHQCSPAQLALAWVLHQGDDVVPIPGTTKIKNLDSNIDSLKVKLTDEDLKEMGSQIREEDVAGGRQFTSFAHTTWKYADTPKNQS
ncbi:putative aldo-keto reductase 1 [Zea mays]|uniref:Putative aldo-keto reductase 1 n=1 Tax=Zea mays TaxID=4577 RepID=A0A3L6GCK2_MAIZE|nr:putative aldo-keto reductase 1 [Zea mays]